MLPDCSASGMNSEGGLDAGRCAVLYPDFRLHIDVEIALLDGVLEIARKFPQRSLLLGRVRPIDLEHQLVAARLVQREFGAPEQISAGGRMRRINGDTDRHVDEQRVVADDKFR